MKPGNVVCLNVSPPPVSSLLFSFWITNKHYTSNMKSTCFANHMAAPQCEDLHKDYLFPHLQLIFLIHPHKLPLLLWKNYTKTKFTFCKRICGQDFVQNGVQQLLTWIAKKILPDWKTVGDYFLKSIQVKAVIQN